MTSKIVVASKNPVKLEAVKMGLTSVGISVSEILGIDVPSGVSAQPMTDDETLTGAENRALNARLKIEDADFWVGIEGGLSNHSGKLTAFAWVVILWKEGMGKSRTTTFQLPEKVSALIFEGYELGAANDLVFGQHNSKQKGGAVGLLTHDGVSRTQLYAQAVQLAIIPYLNIILFESPQAIR